MIYNSMKKLIQKKFYETEAQATEILDVFLMTQKLTPEQYSELVEMAAQVYIHTEIPA